ncbi:cathepsin S-like [Ascaphus truei]|uniref:cathepsin S-like n=1 Tax=Ascaphus truei TaxID=8439 RepID=UPI003F593124
MNLEKTLVVLSASLLFASAAHFLDQEWNTWKSKYEKKYITRGEEDLRRQTWEETWEKVQKHNVLADQGVKSYRLGMNHFADMTAQERSSKNCLSCTEQERPKAADAPTYSYGRDHTIPEEVDWRESKCVTPVRNQGEFCGSCWAFCTVSAIETRYCIKHNQLLSFSEQQLVDCDAKNSGCCGGMPITALQYIYDNGVMESTDYEYTQANQKCSYKNKESLDLNMTKYYYLPGEENIAKSVALDGPVTIAFGVDFDFMMYVEGIFDGDCAPEINHGMTIVGYGTTCDTDYWIIRNSWGEEWGDNGYAKVKRNVNKCSIAEYAATADIPGPESGMK